MCGNEAKDIQRETVDGGKQVPPFADDCQSSQDIFGELRKLKKMRVSEEPSTFNHESNLVQGYTAMVSHASFVSGRVDLRRGIGHSLQFGIQGRNEVGKGETISRVCLHARD